MKNKILDRNCLSFWFPRIEAAGLPVPKTEIIDTEVELVYLLNGTEPAAFDDFLHALAKACDAVGYPAFLRTVVS